jgi:DNA-binding GntR family transcriptional regulator
MTPSRDWRLETPKTAATLAYERLREAVIDGEFAPGQRLTELGIAGLLGISRTPVREAFARLARDGLVRSTRGWGIEVVDPREELTDIYQIREAIEGCAARLAATRASPAEIDGIVALARASAEADLEDFDLRAQLNEAFHLAITTASHAPRLERLVGEYRDLFASPRRLKRFSPDEARDAIDDHRRIAAAIAQRLPDAAEAAIRGHLRRAYAGLLDAPEAGTATVQPLRPNEDGESDPG